MPALRTRSDGVERIVLDLHVRKLGCGMCWIPAAEGDTSSVVVSECVAVDRHQAGDVVARISKGKKALGFVKRSAVVSSLQVMQVVVQDACTAARTLKQYALPHLVELIILNCERAVSTVAP